MKTEKVLDEKWYPVANKSEIPLREGRRVFYSGYEAALFNLGDEYFSVDNRCPHKAGPLADGIVAGKAVFCPLHNWKINLKDGCALSGGKGQVKVYPVKILRGKCSWQGSHEAGEAHVRAFGQFANGGNISAGVYHEIFDWLRNR